MKDELHLENNESGEETNHVSPFSFRYLDEETIQILIDDKIATGG